MRKAVNILLVLAIILGGLEFLLYKRVATLTHPEPKDENVEPGRSIKTFAAESPIFEGTKE